MSGEVCAATASRQRAKRTQATFATVSLTPVAGEDVRERIAEILADMIAADVERRLATPGS